MLQIARHTDYAARIVLHLACLEEGAQASIGEIAEQRLLPEPFVRRLISRLVKGGILATVRGSGGGIRLGRPASEISLLDLVQVMEGPIALNHCVDADHACPFTTLCPASLLSTASGTAASNGSSSSGGSGSSGSSSSGGDTTSGGSAAVEPPMKLYLHASMSGG